MEIRCSKPEDKSAVIDFVTSSPGANIYHTWNWKRLLEATYRYKPQYLLAIENSEVRGMLPLYVVRSILGKKRLVCLPYSHCVAPLFDSREILQAILKYAQDLAQSLNAGYIQIKSELSVPDETWIQASFYFNSILDLNRNIDEIHMGMKASTRRNIKKAQKMNLSIHVGNQPKDFASFYELMVETRKRQGSPPYSISFFYNLYKHLEPSQMKLFLVLNDEVPIAGLIMLYHGENAIYAYGASTSDRGLLQLRPNDLLFWHAITDAHAAGFKAFDFGITPLYNQNLLRYKSQWGTANSESVFTYFLNNLNQVPSIDRTGRLISISSSVIRKLPTPILKTFGPLLMRFFG